MSIAGLIWMVRRDEVTKFGRDDKVIDLVGGKWIKKDV